jgi:hypothetical protein
MQKQNSLVTKIAGFHLVANTTSGSDTDRHLLAVAEGTSWIQMDFGSLLGRFHTDLHFELVSIH